MEYFVEVGGSVDGTFRRNIMVKSREVKSAIKVFNETDAYATIYQYDSEDQNKANIVAPFYIDMDIDNIEENFSNIITDLKLVMNKLRNMFNLSDNDIKLYFSGSKGFHILVESIIFGLEPSMDINEKYKLLALKLKTYTITKCIDTRYMTGKGYLGYLIPLTLRQGCTRSL